MLIGLVRAASITVSTVPAVGGGGGCGIEDGVWRGGCGGGDQGAGAGEVLRQLVGEIREGAGVVALGDDAAEVVEAKQAVGVSGRGCAVVEAAEGEAVGERIDGGGGEGGADGVAVP